MQLQLTGQIIGIEPRNGGWFAVVFQEQGAQYPKKLSTKKPELVQQATQMMTQWATALYNESESTNINPNNGQPYMNRFLEALALPGTVPPPAQQQSHQPPQPVQQFAQQPQQYQPQPQQQWPQQQPQMQQPQQPVMQQQPIVTQNQKEERIMREAAAKVAVQLLDHLDPPDRTLASVVRISEQLVQYFENGVQWQVPPVQPPPMQQPSQNDPGPQQGDTGYGGFNADPGPQQGDPGPGAGWPAPGSDDDIPF